MTEVNIDPNVALREIALAYHDFTCDQGGHECPERDSAPDAMDEMMPGLIAVANVATQLALLHLTVRFDLSPEEAVDYGIYSSVNWPSLLPLLGCAATKTLENGDEIECLERGQHPVHKSIYQGIEVSWEDPGVNTGPDTPEEAATQAAISDAWEEALSEDFQHQVESAARAEKEAAIAEAQAKAESEEDTPQ